MGRCHMEADAPRLAGAGAGGTSAKECGAPPPCFDCNICLEPAAEPVVTLCGHLYCWPCVHRWLRSDQPGAKNCPVCKAAVSEGRLLPLYGRGGAKCATARAPTRASVVGAREHSDGDVDLGNQQERYGYNQGTDYRSWAPVFHSNAGCVLGGLAVAMLPEAFRGGRSLPAQQPAAEAGGELAGADMSCSLPSLRYCASFSSEF